MPDSGVLCPNGAHNVAQQQSPPPVLNLNTLIQLFRSLPPERIAQIPVEQLPENIPMNITNNLPLANRSAVEDLLLAASSYHLARRSRDEQTYGDKVVSALDRAKFCGDTANVRVFKDKIVSMVNMLQDYKRNREKYEIGLFVKNISHIDGLLVDVRSEQVDAHKALKLLADTEPKGEADRERFNTAIDKLKIQAVAVDKLLGEYYVLRLKVMARAINGKRLELEEYEQSIEDIPAQIVELRKKLETSHSLWRRTLSRRKAIEEAKAIQDQISELVHQMKEGEVVIAENDLTLWLDTIVDASLNEHSKNRVSRPARDARISLFYLLNKFCSQQESSARQIAQNPFLQIDPEKAIKYVLMSEQFILNYFANKKKDTTAWLSGAAKAKIDELDDLEKDLLTELRRSTKLMRKAKD